MCTILKNYISYRMSSVKGRPKQTIFLEHFDFNASTNKSTCKITNCEKPNVKVILNKLPSF